MMEQQSRGGVGWFQEVEMTSSQNGARVPLGAGLVEVAQAKREAECEEAREQN